METELVWIDLTSRAQTYYQFTPQSLVSQLNPIRGFFTVVPQYDLKLAADLFTRLNSSQPALFNSQSAVNQLPTFVAAYDVTRMWLAAVNHVIENSGDPMNQTEVITALNSLPVLPQGLSSTSQTYHTPSGQLEGPLYILNYHIASNFSGKWIVVGTWTGQKNSCFS